MRNKAMNSYHQPVLYKEDYSSPSHHDHDCWDNSLERPYVSLVVPAYNESSIILQNLEILCQHMRGLENFYEWELIIVNDGSKDDTALKADAFAKRYHNVHVIHHPVNAGLGRAFKSGFEHCQGDYVITLDLDLSYSPDHIERLLAEIQRTGAGVVVASPYMKGGKVTNVPWLRKVLSVWANRFLSFAAERSLATLTGMVRVYDARFLRDLNVKSRGMEVNPEVIHKAKLLEERVGEIPAHLQWSLQKAQPKAKRRKSSMKILRHTSAVIFFGFLFRPVMFFIVPSVFLFLISCYANAWALVHCWNNYHSLGLQTWFPDAAVAAAFRQSPHTFIIGGMTLMLSIQLLSTGILSMQSKRYFEEVFYLGTAINRSIKQSQ
jgi:glycosyltransferase involved in cell wall biosynthesis